MFPKKLVKQVICDYDNPIVETKAGKLRGVIVDGTYIFRGIKYADAERFHMPKPVAPWDGIKDAIMFGPVCMEISTPIAHDAYNVPHFYFPQDENCQYLNVWTQSTDKNAKKPVMVWIHGGGFATGSSVELYAYDGEELSVFGDVVVVSLNHRLNCIGYLDLSDYGDEYKYSGNVGMADIVEALKWIKENIAAFGGDPDNVTIMGQSGGGMKVSSLLQMPAADGLFHKASIQSGLMYKGKDILPEQSKAFAAKVVANLGLDQGSIKEIEKIPYFKLARAVMQVQADQGAGAGMMSLGPVKDDDYYFGYGPLNGFREETKNIPILVGSVLGEFTNNFNIELAPGEKNKWDDALKDKLFKERLGDQADAIVEEFKKAYPDRNTADVLFIDKNVRLACMEYTEGRVVSGCAPTYLWLFNLECPLNGGTIPWHNAEEAYMFHNAEYLEASYIPGVSENLQNLMTGAWVSFAYYGDPNKARNLPLWKPVEKGVYHTMIFDAETKSACNHDTKLMNMLPDADTTNRGPRKRAPILGGGPRQSI